MYMNVIYVTEIMHSGLYAYTHIMCMLNAQFVCHLYTFYTYENTIITHMQTQNQLFVYRNWKSSKSHHTSIIKCWIRITWKLYLETYVLYQCILSLSQNLMLTMSDDRRSMLNVRKTDRQTNTLSCTV